MAYCKNHKYTMFELYNPRPPKLYPIASLTDPPSLYPEQILRPNSELINKAMFERKPCPIIIIDETSDANIDHIHDLYFEPAPVIWQNPFDNVFLYHRPYMYIDKQEQP